MDIYLLYLVMDRGYFKKPEKVFAENFDIDSNIETLKNHQISKSKKLGKIQLNLMM